MHLDLQSSRKNRFCRQLSDASRYGPIEGLHLECCNLSSECKVKIRGLPELLQIAKDSQRPSPGSFEMLVHVARWGFWPI